MADIQIEKIRKSQQPTQTEKEQRWSEQLRRARTREQQLLRQPRIGHPLIVPPSAKTQTSAPAEETETGAGVSPQQQEEKWQEELHNQRMNQPGGPGREKELQDIFRGKIGDTHGGRLNIGRPLVIPSSAPTRVHVEEINDRTAKTQVPDTGETETGAGVSPQQQEEKWQEELRNQRMNQLRGPGREKELQDMIKKHIGDISTRRLNDDEKKLVKVLQTEAGTDERRQAIREVLKTTARWKSSFLTKTGTLGYAFALGLAILKDFGDGIIDFIDLGTVINWLITTGVSILLWLIIHKAWIQRLFWRFRLIQRAKWAIKEAIAKRLWLWIVGPLVEFIPFINAFPSMTFTVWLFKRSVDRALEDAEREIEELEEAIKQSL